MKRITLIETLVLLAVAVPAFAAITCTGRTCVQTQNVPTNTTYCADDIVRGIAHNNAVLVEIPAEIARDKAVYMDAKYDLINATKADTNTKKAILNTMKNNGANITADDFNGTIIEP